MTRQSDTRPELSLVIETFPDDAILIRRLFLMDPSFRSACEDYATARSTHARLAHEANLSRRAEAEDYLHVIAGLESEIADFLRTAIKVHRL